MKLFVAGAGTNRDTFLFPDLYTDKNCFISFFDLDTGRLDQLVKQKPKMIVCDSGAHAFFSRTDSASSTPGLKAKGKLPDIKTYLQDYAKYCEFNKNKVDYFVELDTQELHGKEFQRYQRALLKDAVGNDKIMGVWHANESDADFQYLLDNYQYIGLEGFRTKRIQLSQYKKMVKQCYEKGIKVHIFASIIGDVLSKIPFYSSDSSAWSALFRYGNLLIFDGTKIKATGKTTLKSSSVNKHNAKYITKLANYGATREGIVENWELLKRNVDCYSDYEEYLTKLWELKGIKWQ